MDRLNILSHFLNKLKDPNALCVFISTHAAYHLQELSERAKSAQSVEEFIQEFLKPDELSAPFADLRTYWGNCSEAEAYEYLKRIRVVTVDESTLRNNVENRLTWLVEGNPATVTDVLAQFALNEVHHELRASDIWNHLEERGYHPCRWGKDHRVLSAVNANNNRFLSQLRDEVIGGEGEGIPRDEVQSIFDAVTSSKRERKRSILLAGEAGIGKSTVILQVAKMLHAKGWPMLAFRVDRLELVQLPEDAGRQLGLPGSPALVLAAIAKGGDCVLIIDQLDAISLASGRNPSFFDCINEIIRQAQVHPRLRLILSCRKFDLDNDHRLRRLIDKKGIADSIMIGRLPDPTVKRVVTGMGLDAERLNRGQIDLLSVPLHLSLLEQFARNSTSDVLDFNTARDLYDRFWDHKQHQIRQRLGCPVKWTQVLDILCNYMSEHQKLSAPKETVDECPEDARAMASEHVLTFDGKEYAFFHENFFDYVFARRFVSGGGSLLHLLKDSEQHLFRRAQVRQILLHKRDKDRPSYLEDLHSLLTSPEIRFHIKRVVFALLRDLPDPTQEEWQVMSQFLEDPADPMAQEVWVTVSYSLPWFQLLDSLGLIAQWLADQNEKFTHKTVWLLSRVHIQKNMPDRIAELVGPYTGHSEEWHNRLKYLMRWADLTAGRGYFELFLCLIDEGVLDEVKGPVDKGFWNLLFSLAKVRPQWACEAIGHYLDRGLILSLKARQSNPFNECTGTIPDSHMAAKILRESASGAPRMFVDQVLPFMIRVMELTTDKTGRLPWRDPVWEYRAYGRDSGIHGIESSLLATMELALCRLAANSPQDFAPAARHLQDSNFETIQYLLIRAYTANGTQFADEAADYLSHSPARLETGWRVTEGDDGIYWATRELLLAVTPHCSEEKLMSLEEMVLNYYTDWEKSPQGHRDFGRAQLILLEGIVSSRRTRVAHRRLKELRRKFVNRPVKPPQPIKIHPIKPPSWLEYAAEKMTDDQWLGAIAKYRDDDMQLQQNGRLTGGVFQISALLEAQVKKESGRFAMLVNRFPDDVHPSYFNAVLGGIAEADLDAQTVLQVCRRCHQLPDHPCGRGISKAIAESAQSPLPQEVMDIVAWYATEDPDPRDELWRSEGQDSSPCYGGDILSAGINSGRGSAAMAIGKLISGDGHRISCFRPTLERLIQDLSIAVRSCAGFVLLSIWRHDQPLAVSLFQRLVETEDILLKTPHIEHFMYYVLEHHFDILAPILDRMLASELPEVVAAGARQACRAALMIVRARPLAEICLTGSEAHRRGAAEVFAANLRTMPFRSYGEDALIRLFHDPCDEVQSLAAYCFSDFEGEELGEHIHVIEAFVRSPSFIRNHECLIEALERTTAKLPDITCQVCERALDAVGRDAGDTSTSAALEADVISKLIVRVCSQSTDPALQTRCLDLIDRMMQMRAYGLDDALAVYER